MRAFLGVPSLQRETRMLSALECAVPKLASLSSLECAVTKKARGVRATVVRMSRNSDVLHFSSCRSLAPVACHDARAHPSRPFRIHQFCGPRQPVGRCASAENRIGLVGREAWNSARGLFLELCDLPDRVRMAC